MRQLSTKAHIFISGISLLLLFAFFFSVDLFNTPLPFGLKCADTRSILWPQKDVVPHKTRRHFEQVHFYPGSVFNKFEKEKKEVCAKDTSIRRILLLGDSQVEFLRTSVFNFCTKNNYELIASIAWYGSTTASWASGDTLDAYLDKYHPDFVICALGLNEILTPSVEPRRKYIQTIKGKIEGKHIPYYWIGPAAWTKDYGIIDVMQQELDTLFYPSQNLVLDRAPDKRHPSMEASKIWFDSVVVAMNEYTPLNFRNKVSEYKRADNNPFVALGRTARKE